MSRNIYFILVSLMIIIYSLSSILKHRWLKQTLASLKREKINDDISIDIDDNCYFDFKEYDCSNALELVNKCNVEFNQNKELFHHLQS